MICAFALSFVYCTPQSPAANKFLLWGYMVPGTVKPNTHLEFKRATAGYDFIALTGLKLSADGTLRYAMTAEEIFLSSASNSNLVFMITFRGTKDGIALLSDKKRIDAAVSAICSFVDKKKSGHLHFDYEYLPQSMVPGLEYFFKKLKNTIRKTSGRIRLSMAVFPQVDFPSKWSSFHDLSVLERYCDEIVLMCYDYHRNGTVPGPVTDIAWAEKNIRHVIKYFAPERIWLGMPAYGYAWKDGGNKATAFSARIGKSLQKKNLCVRDVSGTMRCRYISEGSPVTAYFADEKTRELMMDLARAYSLKGAAVWRVGFD